jgi:hypothetical protein
MSKSQYMKQYRAEQLLVNPAYEADKYQRRVDTVNSDPWEFARLKMQKQRYSAGKRSIPWSLDDTKIVKKIALAEQCSISGRKLVHKINHPNSPSIDRKDSNKGYTPANSQVAAVVVNKAKGEMTQEEFLEMCLDVARHNGYRVVKK